MSAKDVSDYPPTTPLRKPLDVECWEMSFASTRDGCAVDLYELTSVSLIVLR